MDKQHGTNRIEDTIVCCYILIGIERFVIALLYPNGERGRETRHLYNVCNDFVISQRCK